MCFEPSWSVKKQTSEPNLIENIIYYILLKLNYYLRIQFDWFVYFFIIIFYNNFQIFLFKDSSSWLGIKSSLDKVYNYFFLWYSFDGGSLFCYSSVIYSLSNFSSSLLLFILLFSSVYFGLLIISLIKLTSSSSISIYA